MPLHVLVFPVSDSTPCRLDDFLLIGLPAELKRIDGGIIVSKSKIRRLIVAGAVSIGQQQIRHPDQPLRRGQSVVVRLDTQKFGFEKQPDDIAFELSAARILYEDVAIIVVDKPAGLPTEATMVASRDHLQAAVQRFLAQRDGLSEPYVGLHHRLDRETSGLILFTKQRSANAAVHKMFLEHLAHKRYEALTSRPPRLPKAEFKLSNKLARISPKSAAAKWGAVKEGENADTEFRLLQDFPQGLRIEARPLTGRTHQIRVHLASLGMPLLGDTLYGGPLNLRGLACPRVMLHAKALSFPHPVDGRLLTVEAPLPADFLACLKGLG